MLGIVGIQYRSRLWQGHYSGRTQATICRRLETQSFDLLDRWRINSSSGRPGAARSRALRLRASEVPPHKLNRPRRAAGCPPSPRSAVSGAVCGDEAALDTCPALCKVLQFQVRQHYAPVREHQADRRTRLGGFLQAFQVGNRDEPATQFVYRATRSKAERRSPSVDTLSTSARSAHSRRSAHRQSAWPTQARAALGCERPDRGGRQ